MPIISVYTDDLFCHRADLAPDVTAAAQRRITDEELAELQILTLHFQRLQEVLAAIALRPEIEFDEAIQDDQFVSMGDQDHYQDHQYCVVCGECVTCNLRRCRDGGEHQLTRTEK